MDHINWLEQTVSKPLFPDILWSRPETSQHAGKLFIAGGNQHHFKDPAEAYSQSIAAGIGIARVIVPVSLQKTIGKVFEAGEYAPVTPSGSFSLLALENFIDIARWADATLLAGNFSKNSETAILIEKFTDKYAGKLALVGDAIDIFLSNPSQILSRQSSLLVLDFSQLQKLAVAIKFPIAFTSTMDHLKLLTSIGQLSTEIVANVIINYQKTIIVAAGGEVSATLSENCRSAVWTASQAIVWWLQLDSSVFQTLTTAMLGDYPLIASKS